MRALLLLLLLLPAAPALAHPHVWVKTKAEIVYAPDGKIAAVRHHWTFDEAYSAFATQGLDKNGDGKLTPDELVDLAKTNMESLAEFGYFTNMKANGAKQAFGPPRDESLTVEAGLLTLRFELPLRDPAGNRVVMLDVYDPTFFVDFENAAGDNPVTLVGAPKGCALTVTKPKPLPVGANKSLGEEFFQNLANAQSMSASFASRAMAACP